MNLLMACGRCLSLLLVARGVAAAMPVVDDSAEEPEAGGAARPVACAADEDASVGPITEGSTHSWPRGHHLGQIPRGTQHSLPSALVNQSIVARTFVCNQSPCFVTCYLCGGMTYGGSNLPRS